MTKEPKLTDDAVFRAIATAKGLVAGHVDPAVLPANRLREIADKLNVSRIESGAVSTDGFLKRLPNGSYAVSYAGDMNVERRRFTVAHELAHLVLEKHHKHVGRENLESYPYYYSKLESRVNRIAAELLMPTPMVVGAIRAECELRRQRHPTETVSKRSVLQCVGERLGVNEWALVRRCLELPELLAVHLTFQWEPTAPSGRPRYAERRSSEDYIRIVSTDLSELDPSTVGIQCKVHVQSRWGLRVLHCDGWRRPANTPSEGVVETWVVGWGWNTPSLPSWDDSQHLGGTPDVSRLREFDASRARLCTRS